MLRGLLDMQKKLSSSAEVKFFSLNYNQVLKELRGYAKKCIDKGAKAVILIGSLARKDYTAFSDADIIVISDNVPPRPIDRIGEFIDPALPIDIEPRIYTSKEILMMAKKKSRIIKEIIEHGILLSGDEKIIEGLREILKNPSI